MATYYVDGIDGNDSNDGTAEGSGYAWATIDNAMNNVTSGDIVYIKGNIDYNETANIDTPATISDPIIFEGYTSIPGDGGKATMDNTAAVASAITCAETGSIFYWFRNIIISNYSSFGVNITDTDAIRFDNCIFDSNGDDGVSGDNGINFVDCTFSNNAANGIDADVGLAIRCTFYGNAGAIAWSYGSSLCLFCLFYDNGSASNQVSMGYGGFYLFNTLDGDGFTVPTMAGVLAGSTTSDVRFGNIVYNCYHGLRASAQYSINQFGGYNFLSQNEYDYHSSYLWQARDGDLAGQATPNFVDVTNRNYSLAENSGARNIGGCQNSSSGADAGAYQSIDPRDRVTITG